MKKIVNRFFYIDVGGVASNQVIEHINQVKELLKSNTDAKRVAESHPQSEVILWEDFFIPVRGDQKDTKVVIHEVQVS